jgi:thiamine-monophosphate kinase
MALDEFALIDRYFRACGARRTDVLTGVGDDAALLRVPADADLVAATDTLVSGVHFPPDSPAASIGHRALAVNLSDLAAMGARPAWALLALTLPQVEESWLGEFATGLGDLALAHEVELVGGDTTRGPLCVTVQLLGFAPQGTALKRSGGRAGDVLFVSGTPGDAAAGLALVQGRLRAAADDSRYLRERFELPTPRVALGERLREFASACIDVSDGLFADAAKLAQASGTGMEIHHETLPVSQALERAAGTERARELALSGGDDYELCFSVAAKNVGALLQELPPQRWGYSRIGVLRDASGAVVLRDGSVMQFSHSGYQHFS